jgi:hypothetical protein
MWLTDRLAGGVHASVMVKPKAIRSVTVLAAAGAALGSHPSISIGLNVPPITGGVVPLMVMVWAV